MRMSLLDLAIGIEFKVHRWASIRAEIPRPDGFRVTEEIDGKPCTAWRGSESGKYAVYLLRKRGMEHNAVMSRLASILGEKPRYLGIKDTNAVTEQLIYVTRKSKDFHREESFSIEFMGFTSTKLNHTGNIFSIKLETGDKEELKRRVNTIKGEGVLPAFIGYQRFGTRRPITHLVGKALTQRDWCKAVDFILGYPFVWENENIRLFREEYMKGEVKEELLRKIPSQGRNIYLELRKTEDCLSALRKSRVKLSFYVEAYQSYLFNRVLSRKLRYSTVHERDEITIPTDPKQCDAECLEVFEVEGIQRGSFHIEELGISLRPVKRNAFMNVRGLHFDGEFVTFSLERGMYATVVLSEILNADPKEFT